MATPSLKTFISNRIFLHFKSIHLNIIFFRIWQVSHRIPSCLCPWNNNCGFPKWHNELYLPSSTMRVGPSVFPAGIPQCGFSYWGNGQLFSLGKPCRRHRKKICPDIEPAVGLCSDISVDSVQSRAVLDDLSLFERFFCR